MPAKWVVRPIGETFQVVGGGTPSKPVQGYWEPGTVTWFTPTDLTRESAMFMTESNMRISEAGLAHSSAKLFPPGSVMMTSRATIGVTAISAIPAATNQGFITCLTNEEVGTYHLYFWLRSHREQVVSLASGATFKEINKATFRNMLFLRATPQLEQKFEAAVNPLGQLVANLLRQQHRLRSLRDFLLPRLVGGVIDLSSLDIAVPEAAA